MKCWVVDVYLTEGEFVQIYACTSRKIVYVDDVLIACKHMKKIDKIPKRLGSHVSTLGLGLPKILSRL